MAEYNAERTRKDPTSPSRRSRSDTVVAALHVHNTRPRLSRKTMQHMRPTRSQSPNPQARARGRRHNAIDWHGTLSAPSRAQNRRRALERRLAPIVPDGVPPRRTSRDGDAIVAALPVTTGTRPRRRLTPPRPAPADIPSREHIHTHKHVHTSTLPHTHTHCECKRVGKAFPSKA